MSRPPRRHEISRLEAFSDAVFGFALALLVVSADPPASYAQLMDRLSGGASFACCFALLVWIWYEHNSFFRRYGLQDGYTTFLNSLLLFVVLLYVYPLKFMFDSMFVRLLPRLEPPEPMQAYQLANASIAYATGFIAIFLLFTLLYRHAFAEREALQLSRLDEFDAISNIRHHLIIAGVGALSLLVAAFAPLSFAPVAPTLYSLMGPAHWAYGVRSATRRRELAAELEGGPAPVASTPGV